ncbi:glycosyltransferase [Algoriphagus namhaensis]|uniref:Glycosyltransferase n=1 Tax=Algoriphagus namhaensis TaxID=915353 RepID=A0ABV8AQZ8_9BACT
MELFLFWLVFGIGLFIQAIYLLFIFSRLAFFKKKSESKSSSQNTEGVTVTIAAHNEAQRLEKLIPILFEQDYENFEVLIIDDRSTDGTHELLQELMVIYPKLRTVTVAYTPNHVTAKKYALTLGIKVTRNDIILLTDADCVPESKNWIKLMTAPLREKKKTFAIGYSGYEQKPGFLNSWIQFETLLTAYFYLSFGLWRAPFMGIGRNLCYRRSFFIEVKAFKGLWHIEGGDDDLFVNQYATGKNSALVIDPEANMISEPKTDRKSYLTQKKRHLHAGKYYRAEDKQKIGFYAFSHALFWIGGIGLLIYSGLMQNWEQFFVVFGIILSRTLLLTFMFHIGGKKIQGFSPTKMTWLHDFLYLGYFWVLGSVSHQAKTIKWK